MKRTLIEITTSSHGLDYVIHVDALGGWLATSVGERCGGGWPGAVHRYTDGDREVRCPVCGGSGYANFADVIRARAERRRELVEELRRLARLLELGESPFSSYDAPDPLEGRGQAEAEMDRLGAHIEELQRRGAR